MTTTYGTYLRSRRYRQGPRYRETRDAYRDRHNARRRMQRIVNGPRRSEVEQRYAAGATISEVMREFELDYDLAKKVYDGMNT